MQFQMALDRTEDGRAVEKGAVIKDIYGRLREGRGTADEMYVMIQMVHKRLEVQGSMAMGFVDLEKAFDTVPKEMAMPTLWWMGVPKAEVGMVEGMYDKRIARVVVVGEGASEEFEVKNGLRRVEPAAVHRYWTSSAGRR